jgi:hypothetical protein
LAKHLSLLAADAEQSSQAIKVSLYNASVVPTYVCIYKFTTPRVAEWVLKTKIFSSTLKKMLTTVL